MIGNPLQQLELLESQLLRVESKEPNNYHGKFKKTAHVLERLEKSGRGLSKNPQDLRDQIAQLKIEIAQRKIHHTVTVARRAFKEFVKVEALRMVKRLEKNEESETKRATLAQEIELVKNADTIVALWPEEVVFRALAKKFDVAQITGNPFEKRPLNQIETNVFSRFAKRKDVQSAIAHLQDQVLYYTAGPAAPPAAGSAAPAAPAKEKTPSAPKEKKPNEQSAQSTNEEPTQSTRSVSEKRSEASGVNSDPFFAPTNDSFIALPSDNEDDVAMSDVDEENEPFSNIPMLHQGYISGSEDEGEIEPADVQPARRNRRGQRARRRIAELKHGRNANHIKKQLEEEEKQKRAKEMKRRRKQERDEALKKKQKEFESQPIHPSWEARQKQKEKLERAKFEGKKVTFD